MSFASCTAHAEGVSPFPSSIRRVNELMKKFSIERSPEVNKAEFFRSVLCGVERGCLLPVKGTDFVASESSECFSPPKLSSLIRHSRYQEMAVIAPAHPSKLFREKPTDLFSAYGSLNISKPFFNSRYGQITHGNLFERNRDKPIPFGECRDEVSVGFGQHRSLLFSPRPLFLSHPMICKSHDLFPAARCARGKPLL